MAAPIDSPWAGNTLNNSNLGNTTVGHGTSDPTTYEVGRMFLRTDTGVLSFNSGTLGTPVFTRIGKIDNGTADGDIPVWDQTTDQAWEPLAKTNSKYLNTVGGSVNWGNVVKRTEDNPSNFNLSSTTFTTVTGASITLQNRTNGVWFGYFAGYCNNLGNTETVTLKFSAGSQEIIVDHAGTTSNDEWFNVPASGSLDGSTITAEAKINTGSVFLTDLEFTIIEIG